MQDRTLYPSTKLVNGAFILAALVAIAGMWAIHRYAADNPAWLYLTPLIAFLPPLNMQIKRKASLLRIHDGHLTCETGYLSRTRRTLDMAKIQDVTVSQTFGQRLIGVGDLMLESAGESGAMVMRNLDNPREIADAILAESKR